jgi:beta-glucosidase
LHDILRDKWGFKGHVTSDCWAIADFHEHHKVTDTAVESVALAVRNGCDLNCGNLFGYCLQAVQEGLLTEAEIDRAAVNLMAARIKLGIVGNAPEHAYTQIPYETIDCKKHQELNLRAACSSLVLLKNNGVLPINTHKIKTIGVIGPNADSRASLEGNYNGTASDYKTVLQGMQILAEREGIRVLYAQGCQIIKDRSSNISGPQDRLAEALAVTRHSDLVVLCLGLDGTLEGEEGDAGDGDKKTLELPESQRKLAEKVFEAAEGKPVVVVNITGSAMDLRFADEKADAVMQVFYPGALGGLAVASALFGYFSPEGKLPLTFYKSDEDLPDFHEYAMANRTYRYFDGEPLYPFGYGLGYYRFEISNAMYENGRVTAQVTNAGPRDGTDMTHAAGNKTESRHNLDGNAATGAGASQAADDSPLCGETVQVYAEAEGTKERWNLCGLSKVYLRPGESMRVEVEISLAAFMRYDANGDLQPCMGKKTLYVGFGQPDERSAALTGQRALEINVPVKFCTFCESEFNFKFGFALKQST